MVDEEQTGKRTPDDVMENMSGFYEAFIKSKKDIEKRKFNKGYFEYNGHKFKFIKLHELLDKGEKVIEVYDVDIADYDDYKMSIKEDNIDNIKIEMNDDKKVYKGKLEQKHLDDEGGEYIDSHDNEAYKIKINEECSVGNMKHFNESESNIKSNTHDMNVKRDESMIVNRDDDEIVGDNQFLDASNFALEDTFMIVRNNTLFLAKSNHDNEDYSVYALFLGPLCNIKYGENIGNYIIEVDDKIKKKQIDSFFNTLKKNNSSYKMIELLANHKKNYVNFSSVAKTFLQNFFYANSKQDEKDNDLQPEQANSSLNTIHGNKNRFWCCDCPC